MQSAQQPALTCDLLAVWCLERPDLRFAASLDTHVASSCCSEADKQWRYLQVHQRVRLAIRLDEVQRQQTKEKAESSWRQRTADEVHFLLTSSVLPHGTLGSKWRSTPEESVPCGAAKDYGLHCFSDGCYFGRCEPSTALLLARWTAIHCLWPTGACCQLSTSSHIRRVVQDCSCTAGGTHCH